MLKKKVMVMFALVIVISMLFVNLVGCRNTANNTPNPTSSQKSKTVENTEANAGGYSLPIVKQPLTLTYMVRDAEEAGCTFTNMKALVWDEFEKKTGIHIKFDVSPNADYPQKMQLRLASHQNLPDIMSIQGGGPGGGQDGAYIAQYLSDGVIVNLSDYIKKYGVNLRKIFQKYPDYEKNLTLPDGSIAALGDIQPTKYSYMGIGIRKDWLDKLNLKMPETIDDLYNTAKAFMEKDPNGNGKKDEFGMSTTDGLFGYYQLGMAYGLHLCTGAGWAVENGKVGYQWISPQLKDFLKFLNKLKTEGILPKDYASASGDTVTARMLSDQFGINTRMYAPQTLGWAAGDSVIKKANPNAEWIMTPVLKGPYGDGIVVKEPMVGRWRTTAITAGSKHPVEALEWLDWVIGSEEGNRLNMQGIEGKTYHLENGKVVMDTSNINMPSGNTWMGAMHVSGLTDDTIIEATFKLAGLTPDSGIVKDITNNFKYVQEPYVPPIPSPEQGKRASSLLTDVTTYKDEMMAKFISGAEPIDGKFDEYVKNMKSIGLDEILKIYQEGYDKINKK